MKNVFLIVCNAILFSVAFTEVEHAANSDKIFQLLFCCIFRLVIMLCISFQISNAHFTKHMRNLQKPLLCSVVCFFFEILLLRFQL